MPLSVVDALLTEPLMLLKAEEVKANWNWNVKRIWREKCSVLVKRQVAPGPEGMERAYELLQPYYLQVNSLTDNIKTLFL